MASMVAIGPLMQIIGTMTAEEPVTIAGQIRGSVDLSGHALTLMSTAHVDGEIKADEVSIHGEVRGQVVATGRISVHESAVVEGTLETRALSVDLGATIHGDLAVEGRPAARVRLAS